MTLPTINNENIIVESYNQNKTQKISILPILFYL